MYANGMTEREWERKLTGMTEEKSVKGMKLKLGKMDSDEIPLPPPMLDIT